MSGEANVLLDIRGRASSALRAIASTKTAMRGLGNEQKHLTTTSREQARQNRELNRLLDRQSRSLRTLTGDYVALRRALFTLGVRAAITGFAALSSVLVSLGADVVKLTNQVGLLGVAVGALGSSAAGGIAQGLSVWKIALDGVGKAITTTGHAHDLAMEKLTKNGRQLVGALQPLRREWQQIKLVAQDGLAPGLTRAARESVKALDLVQDSVYNTAQALGYLVEHGVDRFVRRRGELRRVARENTITMRRMGDSIIEIGDAWLAASDAARPAVHEMTGEVLHWARGVRRAIRESKRDGGLASFFDDGLRAWKVWTSTIGATGGAIGGILKASSDSAERMAVSINKAAKGAERWVQSEKGQKKLHDGFKALEPVSAEIGKTLGAMAKSLVEIGIQGSGSATRILHGFRTQVLPLVEDLAIAFNDGLLQSIIDLSRETVEFIRNAQPGLKIIAKIVAGFVEGVAGGLKIINNLIERMPAATQALAGLALGATMLLGWARFKEFLAASLYNMRAMVGLAPKLTAAAIAPGVATGARASGGVGVAGGRGGTPARNAPLVVGGSSAGATGMRTTTPLVTPTFTNNGGRFATPYRPTNLQGGMPGITGSATQTSSYAPPKFTKGPLLPPVFAMPGPSKGDPLTGVMGGGSASGRTGKNAGLGSFYRTVATNTAGGFAAGVGKGAAKAAPFIKGALKFGFYGAALGGIMGALSKIEVGSTFGNRVNSIVSGVTGGLVQSNDSRASEFANTAAFALQDRTSLKLDARSDQQKALLSKWAKQDFGPKGAPSGTNPSLNLAKPQDIQRLKEWNNASVEANRLTREQADALNKAANQALDYSLRIKGAKDANRQLKGAFITENDLKPGVRGLDLLASHFRGLRKNTKPHLADVRNFTRESMRSIKRYMVEGSEGAKSATSRAFMAAAAAIKRGMREGTIDADRGAKKLHEIFRKNLAMYGIKGTKADHYLSNSHGDLAGKDLTPTTVGKGDNKYQIAGGAERGGFFVGNRGERGRDTVPAVLNGQKSVVARGEYVGVLNGEQQQAFDTMAKQSGYGGMRGFFESHNTPHSKTKKFAAGGIVPIPGEPGESISSAILPSVLKLDRRYKLDITDGYATSGHAPGGEHPKGLAIDAVPDFADGGSWDLIDQLAAWAKTKLGSVFRWIGYDGVPNHGRGNHIHLSWLADAMGLGDIGGDIKRVKASGALPGPMQGLVQGGLDALRRGAQAALEGAVGGAAGGSGVEGKEGAAAGATGNGAGMMRRISRERGWNFADWWEVDRRETSHGANLLNPSSGAFNRGQFMPGITEGDFGPGSRHGASMTEQIQAMADYIASRYGNPTKAREHHDQFNWYAYGMEPQPPSTGQNAPTVNLNDGKTPPSKKKPAKKKRKKKPPFIAGHYPSGVKRAVRMSEKLIHKGKRKGKIRPLKLRSKVRRARSRLQGGKWIDDPAWVDPLTGEALDVEQQPLFNGIRSLRDRYPGLLDAADRLTERHALTDESSTLSLAGDDLRRWLAANGSTPEQIREWIASYGDQLDVANISGFTVNGKQWGGLDQFGAEINEEIASRQALYDNWKQQSAAALGTNTKGPLHKRRHRLAKLRDIFKSNRDVIHHTKAKIEKSKKPRSWKKQVKDNDKILDALRRHKRDSDRMPKDYQLRIDHDIDRLTDLNTELRDKKPKKMTLGMTHVRQVLDQRQRENAWIAGGEGVTSWAAAVQSGGGLAGVAVTSLDNWRAMDDYRGEVIGESSTGMLDEQGSIARLRKELQDFKDSGWVPPPEKINAGGGMSAADEALKQIGLQALRGERLGQFQGGTLREFASLLGMRSLGAFSHGAVRFAEGGIALVHKNETIVPDPDGPFRNGMTMNRLQGGAQGGGDVYLIADGDVGRFLKMIDLRIVRGTAQANVRGGAKVRALKAAPGMG